MAFNTFNNSEESSLERGNPVTNTTKTAAKAVSAQAAQQAKDAKKAADSQIVDFLYGNTVTEEGTDENKTKLSTITQQLAPTQKPASNSSQANPAASGDDAKLEQTRERLASLHAPQQAGASGLHRNQMPDNIRRRDYFEETFGENAWRRRDQEKKQELQQKEQEEEEKKQQEEEEKRQREEEMMDMQNRGNQKGRNLMGKKASTTLTTSIALKRAQTKAESSRGTVG
ncbi:MAG: hypothetical protein ACRD4B_01400 [Acidobacteriota bacterium]